MRPSRSVEGASSQGRRIGVLGLALFLSVAVSTGCAGQAPKPGLAGGGKQLIRRDARICISETYALKGFASGAEPNFVRSIVRSKLQARFLELGFDRIVIIETAPGARTMGRDVSECDTAAGDLKIDLDVAIDHLEDAYRIGLVATDGERVRKDRRIRSDAGNGPQKPFIAPDEPGSPTDQWAYAVRRAIAEDAARLADVLAENLSVQQSGKKE